MNQFFRFFCINLVLPLVYHMKAAHQQQSRAKKKLYDKIFFYIHTIVITQDMKACCERMGSEV
jgi:high-affinity Fe2+/Pb2+ permease